MPRTKRLKTTTVIVRNEEGKFLGVSRKDNYNLWGFAGGKCEKKESPEDCAKRELLEETGLVAEELKFLDEREYINNYNRPKTIDTVFCYEVTKYSGDLLSEEELKARGEGMVAWVGVPELIAGAFADYNVDLLTQYYDLKHIYLVEEHYDYEGSAILSVHTKYEDAIRYCEDFTTARNERSSDSYVKTFEGIYRTGGGGLEVTSCILDVDFYEPKYN